MSVIQGSFSTGLFLIQKRKWDIKKIWNWKKTKGVPYNINTLCKNTCIKFFIVRFSFIFVRKNRLTLHTNKFRCLHLCKSRLNTIHEKGKTLSFFLVADLLSTLRTFSFAIAEKKRKSSTRTLIASFDRFSRNVHVYFSEYDFDSKHVQPIFSNISRCKKMRSTIFV